MLGVYFVISRKFQLFVVLQFEFPRPRPINNIFLIYFIDVIFCGGMLSSAAYDAASTLRQGWEIVAGDLAMHDRVCLWVVF